MAGRSEFLPQDRREWLLAIGQRLRAEYAAIGDPIPDRLAALVARLETPAQTGPADPGQAPSDGAPPRSSAAGPAPDRSAPESPRPPIRDARAGTGRRELR